MLVNVYIIESELIGGVILAYVGGHHTYLYDALSNRGFFLLRLVTWARFLLPPPPVLISNFLTCSTLKE